MEELEKILKFIKKLEKMKGRPMPRFELFSDGSCGVRDYYYKTFISAQNIKDCLKQIENYQWDTNTNQNTNPAK